MNEQIISIWVENTKGVLAKVAGFFSEMEIFIVGLAVGDAECAGISRITIIIGGNDEMVESAISKLQKIVNIVKIKKINKKDAVIRELAFIMVNAPEDKRPNIINLVDIFRASIVDVGVNSMTIEVSGDAEKIKAMEELLRPYGIIEIVRSGSIAIDRSNRRIL